MADAFAELEAEYCPPLDPALLSAIFSDYDLNDAGALRCVRDTLDQLKESALLEEAAGFDPSGTGAQDEGSELAKRAESCPETSASRTGETDLTSLSNGMSLLDLGEVSADEGKEYAEDLETLDEDTKVKLLQDIFGDRVTKYSVQHTLRKCKGRWQRALEELLNHVGLAEAEYSDDGSKIATKGVDAFSENNTMRRKRKGKAKGKRLKDLDTRQGRSLPTSPVQSPATLANKWQTATQEVDFISSRIRIATATVSSVYYEKGASVSQTIATLLKASMEESKHIVTETDAVSTHARKLGREFPTVAPDYLATIVRLTHPSTTAAHELAEALTAKPEVRNGGIHIIPHYRTPLSADEDTWEAVEKKQRLTSGSRTPELDGPEAAARASSYASVRATAFAQASAAHRKAKSNPLMGGAAAYYSQVGREYAALDLRARAAAADQLAATQSTRSQLDLHGIDVVNGIRIAQEKVDDWWAGLGESRINGRLGADDRSAGYRIVVGLGRHSEGGKGKLGPAVSRALREGGWNVENAGAVIVVKGKAKR